MKGRGARGFTLVEVVVALVVSGIVVAVITRTTIVSVQAADRTRERLRMLGAVREAGSLLGRELNGLDPVRDLGPAGAESLTVRAVRGSGRSCGTDLGAIVIPVSSFHAWRLPDPARDSILVLDAAGRWIAAALEGAVTRSACTDGQPGLRLPMHDSIVGRAAAASLPIRVAEWIRYRFYQSGADWWLGARSLRAGDVVQPLADPFPARGLEFRYLDRDGAATTPGLGVHAIAIVLRSDSRYSGARAVRRDSALAVVALDELLP